MLHYMSFLNPFWLCTTTIFWLLLHSVKLDPIEFIARIVQLRETGWIIIVALYTYWTIGIICRTRTRSIIIGSKSIYVRDLKRRFRYDQLFIERSSQILAESIKVEDRVFPMSVFIRRLWFHSLGFVSLSAPLESAVRKKRGVPAGRSINQPLP